MTVYNGERLFFVRGAGMQSSRRWLAGLLGFAMLLQVSAVWASDLREQPEVLQNFVTEPMLAHAAVGFQAVDLESGAVVAEYNEEMILVPASTMKIVTSAAALSAFGSEYRFKTQVLYDGAIDESGTLQGNLYVRGLGDPTLGSDGIARPRRAFLDEWCEGIQGAGIQSIAGNIVVLDDGLGYRGISPKWLVEDLGTDYGAGVYGIGVYDNVCRVYVRSGAVGTVPEVVRVEPAVPGLKIKNELRVVERPLVDPMGFGYPLDWNRRIYGEVAANRGEIEISMDIPDPGLFLAEHLRSELRSRGIPVSGAATTARLTHQRPKQEILLAETRSVPLTEIVRVLLYRSDNHYTEHLYEWMKAEKKPSAPEFFKGKGLNTKALVMRDGSGLSPQNGMSARFLTEVLGEMAKTPGYRELLPVVGRDGTVAYFLRGTPLDGKAWVKTGSMSGVQAYAGYAEKDGRKYAFTLIVNNWDGKRSDLRKKIETLLVGLF